MVRGSVAVQSAPVFSNELDTAFHKLQSVGSSAGTTTSYGGALPSKDWSVDDFHLGGGGGEKAIPSKYEELFYNPSFSSLSVEQLMPMDSTISLTSLQLDKQQDNTALNSSSSSSSSSEQDFDISSLLQLVNATNKESGDAPTLLDFVIPEPPLQFISGDENLTYDWDSTMAAAEDPFMASLYTDEAKIPAPAAVSPPLPPASWGEEPSTLNELDFMLPPPAKKPATPLDSSTLAEWFPELAPAPTDFWPLVPSPAPPTSPPPQHTTPTTPLPAPDSPQALWSHDSPKWSHDSPQWSHDSPMSTTSADIPQPEAIVVAEKVDATSERGGGVDGGKTKSTMLFGQQEDAIVYKLLVLKPVVGKKPLTRDKLVAMPVEEFNQLLETAQLGEIEVAFMKEWRRRGKNKAAAQVARKRKREELTDLDQEVEGLREQKVGLQQRYDQLRSHIATLKENAMAAEDNIYSRYSVRHARPVSRDTHTIHVTDDKGLVLVPKISSQVVMF